MMALMNGCNAKELGGRSGGCGGAFAGPIHRRNVVGGVFGRTLSDIKTLSGGFLLEEAAGEFQVGVGDITSRIFEGHQTSADVLGENVSPEDRPVGRESVSAFGTIWVDGENAGATRNGCRSREPDAAGADARGIVRTQESWICRDQLL